MEKLKLSAADWCFYQDRFRPEEYYGKLAEMGYEAVEMVPPGRREAAKASGLKILNLSGPGMEEGLNNRAHHGRLVGQVRQVVEEAAGAGIPAVIVFSGSRGALSEEEGLRNCAEAFASLVPEAEEKGVDLLFEMLNSHDHKDYQADHSSFGFSLVKMLSSARFKVLYDIYHLSRMGEEVLPVLLEHRRDIAHVHVAEVPLRHLPQGNGRVNYGEIVRQFHAAGYRGYWGMEFLPQQDPFLELQKAYELFQSFLG